MTRDNTATRSSRFIVSTMHLHHAQTDTVRALNATLKRDFVVGEARKAQDSLLEPQREVGGVADHSQQVGRVLLFVFFGPDAADQLGRPDGSVKGGGGAYHQRDTALNPCDTLTGINIPATTLDIDTTVGKFP